MPIENTIDGITIIPRSETYGVLHIGEKVITIDRKTTFRIPNSKNSVHVVHTDDTGKTYSTPCNINNCGISAQEVIKIIEKLS